MMTGEAAARQPAVPRELDRLAKAIDELHEASSVLEQRLEAYVLPRPPTNAINPAINTKAAESQPQCVHSEALHKLHQRVDEIHSRLVGLAQAFEG